MKIWHRVWAEFTPDERENVKELLQTIETRRARNGTGGSKTQLEEQLHGMLANKDFMEVKLCPDDPIRIKGPTVVWLSGGLTTDDAPLSVDMLPNLPLTARYFNQILPYINIDDTTLVGELTGKLPDYVAGHINLTDKLLGFSYRQNAEDTSELKRQKNDMVKVYCVSYSRVEDGMANYDKLASDPEHYFCPESMELVRRLFLPVLATDGKMVCSKEGGMNSWKITGKKKKDIQAIAKNLSNITFTGNSYGTGFLVRIENALQYAMNELGYTQEERRTIMSSVCSIMITNNCPYRVLTGPRFKSIFFEGINDRVADATNAKFKVQVPEADRYYHPPIKTDGKASPESPPIDFQPPYLRIEQCDGDRLLVLANVNRKTAYWKERLGTFDYTWVDNDHTGHHVAHYTTRGEPYSILPDLVERGLRNAVKRTKIPVKSMQDFFRPCSLWPPVGDAMYSMSQMRSDELTGMVREQFTRMEKEKPPLPFAEKVGQASAATVCL